MIEAIPLLERLGMIDKWSPARESAVVKVANDVVEVLQRHDLAAAWEGQLSLRIAVQMSWKRRR